MEIDADKILNDAMRDALREGIKAKLTGYNSPLDKLLAESIAKRAQDFRAAFDEAIGACVLDQSFRDEIASSVRRNLAKTLIQRFGGEIEKQVNALKSDPTTRARITLAIEEIVKAQAKQ